VDPRSPAAGLTPSPLEQLAEAGRTAFPHLMRARERTLEALAARRAKLGDLAAGPGTAVVLMGSWGRRELTRGSDDDFVVLGEGHPSPDDVRAVLDRPPGVEGVFGGRVLEADLVQRIGLGHDTNENLTRRMLFLLESVALTGEAVHAAARAAVLRRYLDAGVRDQRVPRFLLNDLIRYWRTICVDFEGKAYERAEEGWGLRNAKLRTSRKLLFAGGLLPVLECHELQRDAMPAALERELALPPTDRVAAAFLRYEAVDAGARTLGAYDAFVGLLDDDEARAHLRGLTREAAQGDRGFRRARALGDQVESGLLALLFERHPLARLVREYLIF
jgi:hypothetical protein